MFKKMEERMSILRRVVGDIQKSQIKSAEKKTTMSNMKNILNGTNRAWHGIRKLIIFKDKTIEIFQNETVKEKKT